MRRRCGAWTRSPSRLSRLRKCEPACCWAQARQPSPLGGGVVPSGEGVMSPCVPWLEGAMPTRLRTLVRPPSKRRYCRGIMPPWLWPTMTTLRASVRRSTLVDEGVELLGRALDGSRGVDPVGLAVVEREDAVAGVGEHRRQRRPVLRPALEGARHEHDGERVAPRRAAGEVVGAGRRSSAGIGGGAAALRGGGTGRHQHGAGGGEGGHGDADDRSAQAGGESHEALLRPRGRGLPGQGRCTRGWEGQPARPAVWKSGWKSLGTVATHSRAPRRACPPDRTCLEPGA